MKGREKINKADKQELFLLLLVVVVNDDGEVVEQKTGFLCVKPQEARACHTADGTFPF